MVAPAHPCARDIPYILYIKSSGSNTTWVVPLRQGVFNSYRTRPFRVNDKRCVDTAGLVIYRHRREITVAGITFQQALAFKLTANAAGQMTLYMEIYDSANSKLIAHVIDPEAADNGLAQRANRVTNKVAADRIIGRWAELLVKRLDEAKEHKVK